MIMKKYLVSYATPDHRKNQRRLNESALNFGIDNAMPYSSKNLKETLFYQENKATLTQKRGSGYWLWKPYVILTHLEKIHNNDLLIYSDVGIEIIKNISPLVDLCISQGGILLFRNHENLNRTWTKRDCFVSMECDEEKYHNSEQTTASFQIYVKNSWSLSFLKEYLHYCQMGDVITDSPNTLGMDNFSDFIDHRHDQSVLSLLAVKHDIGLFRDPSQFGNHRKLPELREQDEWLSKPYSNLPCAISLYPTLLNHHRERPVKFDQRVKGKLRRLYHKAQKLLSR